MAEKHTPGVTTVYHDQGIAIDPECGDEVPELLSEVQVERRAEVIALALNAHGLRVTSYNEIECGHIRVENPDTLAQANLYLDVDGGAAWDVYADTPERTPCARIVAGIARALS